MCRNMAREMRSTMESSRATAVAGRCVCDEQRGFAEQRARLGDDLGVGGAFRLERKRAVLDDVGAVGGLAGREQHLAGFDRIGLGADGEDAQGRSAEAAQNRHLAQKRNVILDGHTVPRSGRKIMLPTYGSDHGTSL